MNTRKLILIDKYIAKPIGYLLNFFVRLAGKIFNIDHSLEKEFETIAICKFKGMGSIIQATPMLDALRKRYPNAELIFISTIGNTEILKAIKLINTLVLIDDKSLFRFLVSSVKAILFLIRKRPGVYIDLEIYSDFSTLFAAFTFSVNRIGFYLRSSSFRMGIYTHMMYFNSHEPISKVYLQIASLFTKDIYSSKLYSFDNIVEVLPNPNDRYIVVNPNASDLRLERRWGSDKFIELIQRISKDFPHMIIYLIGSKIEWEYTEKITKSINLPHVKNIAGTQNISQLIGCISKAQLMITNDTGPMHIAFSTGTLVLCLFGPCSPEQYFFRSNALFIYKKVYCSPCVHDFEVAPCNGNNVCMKLIEVSEVFEKVSEVLLKSEIQEPRNADLTIRTYNNETIGLIKR